MRSLVAAVFALIAQAAGAEVIDRIAVVVGKTVVKTSDIARDMRVAAFLNKEPLATSNEARRKAADRLVDQAIIRDQIQRGGYTMPADSEADALMDQLKRDRFGGSQSRLQQELARYGLTQERLRQHLLWQLAVLSFIDQRFRPGVTVSDEEVREYYEKHTPELRRQFPNSRDFEELEPKIRASMEAERIDQNFERWLSETRKRNVVEYKKEALQ